MGILDRFRRRPQPSAATPPAPRVDDRALRAELLAWIASRPGTEAWIEEPNDFNRASILLVAGDGESHRWPIPDVPWAGDLCRKHKIAFHRGGIEPYPQRMRDYKARERALAKQLDRGER